MTGIPAAGFGFEKVKEPLDKLEHIAPANIALVSLRASWHAHRKVLNSRRPLLSKANTEES